MRVSNVPSSCACQNSLHSWNQAATQHHPHPHNLKNPTGGAVCSQLPPQPPPHLLHPRGWLAAVVQGLHHHTATGERVEECWWLVNKLCEQAPCVGGACVLAHLLCCRVGDCVGALCCSTACWQLIQSYHPTICPFPLPYSWGWFGGGEGSATV